MECKTIFNVNVIPECWQCMSTYHVINIIIRHEHLNQINSFKTICNVI